MEIVQIAVVNKKATNTTPDVHIVCGNSGYQVTFDFDAEWKDHADKVARFVYYRDGAAWHQDEPFTGDTVDVPVLSNISYVLIGVYAGDLSTTTPARVICDRSILCGDTMEAISPELRAALQAQIGNLDDLTTAEKSSLVAAINEVARKAGGEISDDQIAQAVTDYLDAHPVQAGATAEQAAQIQANKEAIEQLQQGGGHGDPGEDGGYYTPVVTQPAENKLQFDFTASKADMPAVDPVQITLPSGGNVDLTGYATEQYVKDYAQPKGNYLESTALPTAINNALAQAKASGEFDGAPGEPGYTPVKGVDYFDGEPGEPGKTPVKGTDYYTEADKTEMVNAVLSALPTWTGGAY